MFEPAQVLPLHEGDNQKKTGPLFLVMIDRKSSTSKETEERALLPLPQIRALIAPI